MSQRAEQITNAKDTGNKVEQKPASSEEISSEEIQRLYDSIWNDRKPAPGAMLTDAERTQYGRQNSVGVPVKNIDGSHCKELPKAPVSAEKGLPDIIINNDCADRKSKCVQPSDLTDRNDKRPILRADGGKGDGYDDRPYYTMPQPTRDNDRDGAIKAVTRPWRAGTDPGEVVNHPWRVGTAPGEVIPHNSQKENLEDRTQKVSYPDGSSRVVLRGKDGQILVVVNPDGSRLERQPGKPGEAPFWQAYGRYDTPITADSFRGNVEMSADGTFRMVKIYPVPQIYEQKPNGDYRKAYKGGAAEQWTSATLTDTMLYPTENTDKADKTDKSGNTFKAREIKFAANQNGILKATSVADR